MLAKVLVVVNMYNKCQYTIVPRVRCRVTETPYTGLINRAIKCA